MGDATMGGDWKRWEKCLEWLAPEIANERRRVLQLLAAHQSYMGMAYVRLMNLVANGCDLDEEMKLPPEDRAGGFNWPDE